MQILAIAPLSLRLCALRPIPSQVHHRGTYLNAKARSDSDRPPFPRERIGGEDGQGACSQRRRGFAVDAGRAMDQRVDHLIGEGLARRQGQRVIFARDLLDTLRRRELSAAAARISAETGLIHRPSAAGEQIAGVYVERLALSSGRLR